MKRFQIAALLMILVVAIACSSKLSEEEYYKNAMDFYNKEEYASAIENFEKLIEYYPESENAPKSLFMIAFICANHTNDLEKAEKTYKAFLDKYPDHELAASAKSEIQMLGKDINEWPVFQQMQSDEETENKDEKTK